jgi:hypothetical protein
MALCACAAASAGYSIFFHRENASILAELSLPFGLAEPRCRPGACAVCPQTNGCANLTSNTIATWQRRLSTNMVAPKRAPACAIVGSTGTPLSPRAAAMIDAASTVVRVGGMCSDAWAAEARHVGRRTTHRVWSSPYTLPATLASESDAPIIHCPTSAWGAPPCWQRLAERLGDAAGADASGWDGRGRAYAHISPLAALDPGGGSPEAMAVRVGLELCQGPPLADRLPLCLCALPLRSILAVPSSR